MNFPKKISFVILFFAFLLVFAKCSKVHYTKYGNVELSQHPTSDDDRIVGRFCPTKLNFLESNLKCIRFESVTEDTDHHLSITDDYNNPIIQISKSYGNYRYMKVGQMSFVETSDTKEDLFINDPFSIPFDDSDEAKHSEFFQNLKIQPTSTNSTILDALHYLKLSRKDFLGLSLLKKLAFAIGRIGITGNRYPCSLPIYFTAKALLRYDAESESNANAVEENDSEETTRETRDLQSHSRQRRSCTSSQWSYIRNWCNPYYYSYWYYRPSCSNDCFGMCGYSCSCWTYFCDDCCIHRGCYAHDRCCRISFWSVRCIAPYGFSCDSYYVHC